MFSGFQVFGLQAQSPCEVYMQKAFVHPCPGLCSLRHTTLPCELQDLSICSLHRKEDSSDLQVRVIMGSFWGGRSGLPSSPSWVSR